MNRPSAEGVGVLELVKAGGWPMLPLLLLSATLSYASFLPLIWVSTAFNIIVLVFFLGRILWLTRSRVAMWYAASITITLFATLPRLDRHARYRGEYPIVVEGLVNLRDGVSVHDLAEVKG